MIEGRGTYMKSGIARQASRAKKLKAFFEKSEEEKCLSLAKLRSKNESMERYMIAKTFGDV